MCSPSSSASTPRSPRKGFLARHSRLAGISTMTSFPTESRMGQTFGNSRVAFQSSRPRNKFLQAIHSQVLQDVNFRLDNAFKAFHAGIARRPKFRRVGGYNSFAYPQEGGFRIDCNNRLKLSKIGGIRIRLHRAMDGVVPKTCTIVRDIDQWYACISVEAPNVQRSSSSVGPAIGVDLGVANLVALSDGTVVPNPRFLARVRPQVELPSERAFAEAAWLEEQGEGKDQAQEGLEVCQKATRRPHPQTL